MQKIYLLLLCTFFVAAATAQDFAPQAPVPVSEKSEAAQEENEPEEKAKPVISGSADVYYQYNFNGETPGLTAFTPDHNSFSLGMAKVAVAKEFGKVGFGVDLGFGPRADAANGYAGTSFAQLQQLFITYRPWEKVKLTAGNFGTHIGYELIDPTANFHYSTSYMFSYGPFFHTGIKADIAVTDKVGVMVGLFDDTDNKFDVIDGKHFGAQVSYAAEIGDIYLNYLTGTNGIDTVSFNQIDLTAAFELSEKMTLGINATVKNSQPDDDRLNEDATWFGAAVYLGYTVSDNVTLGLRAESFNDNDGAIFGVPDLSIFATTLSANIVIGDLTIIPELRIDTASEDIFTDVTDAENPEATGISPSLLVAAVYAF